MKKKNSLTKLPKSKKPKKLSAKKEALQIVSKFHDIIKNEEKDIKKKYYVDNDRFEKLIGDFYKTGVWTDELAMCLANIANRMAFRPNFVNYTWREEMIGDGLLKSITALIKKKFDFSTGFKAFSYFSRIVFNAFRNRIKVENRENDVIREYKDYQYDSLVVNPNEKLRTSTEQNNEDD